MTSRRDLLSTFAAASMGSAVRWPGAQETVDGAAPWRRIDRLAEELERLGA